MTGRRIADHHLVRSVGVREEVKDPLVFHQPAGEVEIGFAVLHAVVARLIGPLQLIRDVQRGEHRLEDVRHSLLLKDPALRVAREQPKLWNQLRPIAEERLRSVHARGVAALADPADDAVKVARAADQVQRDGQRLGEQVFELDRRGGQGQHLGLEREQARDRLGSAELLQQQHVLAQRRGDRQRLVVLRVARHQCLR